MDEDELMQTDPIYLSSDEDSTPKYPMSDEQPPNTKLSQIVVHTNHPIDVVLVKISSYNVEITHLSSSATSN